MLIPTISFRGNCNDAIAFYKETLGAQIKSVSYYKDAPAGSEKQSTPPDFVVDSDVVIDGQTVMMFDDDESRPVNGCFYFSLSKDTVEEVRTIFNKLVEGGKIITPLAPVYWSPLFGIVEDRFGIAWMITTSN